MMAGEDEQRGVDDFCLLMIFCCCMVCGCF